MTDDMQVIEAVRQILRQLHLLVDEGRVSEQRIERIRRETIFFLYEGGEAAKWDLKRPHSSAARRLREQAKPGVHLPLPVRRSITYDHAIPLVLLRDGLRAASDTVENLHLYLKQYVWGVVITRDENFKLNAAGLRSRLPEGAAPNDLTARYHVAGIAFDASDKAILL